MIITLPLTVKNDAPLGYWLTPIVADALARQLGERGLIFYGTLGLKKPDAQAERIYLDNLNFLEISAERCADAPMLPELLGLCSELASVGDIGFELQDCYRCPCGRLELPVRIARFAKEKTFTRTGHAYVCRACGEPSTVRSVSSRILRLKEQDVVSHINIYPNWYRGEVLELQRQIQQQGIPWSKDRSTGIEGDLDPELVWSLMPLLLTRAFSEERVRIVVTNQVIRQALVTIWLARAIDSSFEADLIITPCIDHPGSPAKWRLNRLVNLGYSGALIRCMLIGSLGWQTKRAGLYEAPSGVEHRRFNLFKRHVRLAEENHGVPYDLRETFKNLGHQNLAQGLRHAFNPENFDYKSLTGVL